MATPVPNPLTKPARRHPVFVAAMLSAAALFCIVAVGVFLYLRPLIGPAFVSRPFDAATWRDNPVSDAQSMTLGTVRQTMVDDLIKQRTLIGMTREEVKSLLGPPHVHPSSELVYILGSERSSLAMDPEALHIYFENDRVHKAQILSH